MIPIEIILICFVRMSQFALSVERWCKGSANPSGELPNMQFLTHWPDSCFLQDVLHREGKGL